MRIIKQRLKKETPRSLVLLIDLTIVALSYMVTNFIFNSFQDQFDLERMIDRLPLILLVYLIAFFIFKPYRGIIRQTSLKDATSVLWSCLVAGSILLAVGFIVRYFVDSPTIKQFARFSFSVIVFHSFISTLLMVYCRAMYKTFYRWYVLETPNKVRSIIYGAGDSGIITLNALQNDTYRKSLIFAFVDDNKKKQKTTIHGINVLSPDVLTESFIVQHRIDEIILSIQNITNEQIFEITRKLDKLPVKLKIIPPASNWLDGKYTSKQIKKLKIEDLLGRKPINLDNPIIDEEIVGKVVVVTGAAGSIGGELARQIAQKAFKQLILIDVAESALYDIQQGFKTTNSEETHFIIGNIRDYKRMEQIFIRFRPDIVFHAAAYKHVPLMEQYPFESVNTNVRGTKNVADLSVLYGVKKFVMISTDKAVNPTNVMGATKRIAEIYVSCLNKKSATNFIVTRFGNVLGSNGSVIPLFKRQIEKGGPLTVTHESITRFFMTIPEACQLVLEAAVMGNGGEIYVFDMGKSVKIMDLAKRMIYLSGLKYPDDIDIRITGLRPGEKIYEELLADKENTIKTHHDKIMIAKVRDCDCDEMEFKINKLITFAQNHFTRKDNLELVKLIKSIVPEYISQNSAYEALDKQPYEK
ncbi:nucleoside-diphosphate sugar epimerase/dehydratase [uncultured Weeksella sp.]|uniref:polysaccharide biosynthesis protein n=1 Tax=uncultured Weeksella sp. TaxID=1161389 RepID=UPI00259BB1A6|nr:nucleoside-diphosphate sugar epimerase/dehydratase [uncultured Weeksella sp.]